MATQPDMRRSASWRDIRVKWVKQHGADMFALLNGGGVIFFARFPLSSPFLQPSVPWETLSRGSFGSAVSDDMTPLKSSAAPWSSKWRAARREWSADSRIVCQRERRSWPSPRGSPKSSTSFWYLAFNEARSGWICQHKRVQESDWNLNSWSLLSWLPDVVYRGIEWRW